MLLKILLLSLNISIALCACPVGWLVRNKDCWFLNTKAYNWNDARNWCNALKGDLLSIHNAGDLQFAQSLAGLSSSDRTWVGATDENTEGTWRWSDGTPFDFLFWDPGQPHGGDKENCGDLRIVNNMTGLNDEHCNNQHQFICLIRGLA